MKKVLRPICKLIPLTKKLEEWIENNKDKLIFEDNKTEYELNREFEETNKKVSIEYYKYNTKPTQVRITKWIEEFN